MPTPLNDKRRIEQLEQQVAELSALIGSLQGRRAAAGGKRWAFLARTVAIDDVYPGATANTFGIQFVSREFERAAGRQDALDTPRSATPEIGRTVDGSFLPEGSAVVAIPSPARPGAGGLVRWNLVAAGKAQDPLIVFTLNDETGGLSVHGRATANRCAFVGDAWEETDQIVEVADSYAASGLWSARNGARGVAMLRGDGKYEIVFMEMLRTFIEARSLVDRGSRYNPTRFAATTLRDFQQGDLNDAAQSIFIQDELDLFPMVEETSLGLAEYDYLTNTYRAVQWQQMGLFATANLSQTLFAAQTDNVQIDNFLICTFSPFNKDPPAGIPQRVLNSFRCVGEEDDRVFLVFDRNKGNNGDWVIVRVLWEFKQTAFVAVADPFYEPGQLVPDIQHMFYGEAGVPPGPGARTFVVERPCWIQFIDWAGDLNLRMFATNGQGFAAAQWAGLVTFQNETRPMYLAQIGPQEFEGFCTSDLSKGETDTFKLCNNDGSPSRFGGVQATCRWNSYKANKKAIIENINGFAFVANQIEK